MPGGVWYEKKKSGQAGSINRFDVGGYARRGGRAQGTLGAIAGSQSPTPPGVEGSDGELQEVEKGN